MHVLDVPVERRAQNIANDLLGAVRLIATSLRSARLGQGSAVFGSEEIATRPVRPSGAPSLPEL